jgi:hypothetical protein
MSEPLTGTVTMIDWRRCPARTGELGSRHPRAGNQDSPVVSARHLLDSAQISTPAGQPDRPAEPPIPSPGER